MYGGEEEKAQPFVDGVDEIIFSYIYASTPVQLEKKESLYKFSAEVGPNRFVESTSMIEYANKGCLKGIKILIDRYFNYTFDDNNENYLYYSMKDALEAAINNGYYQIVEFLYSLKDKLNNDTITWSADLLANKAGQQGFLNIYKIFVDEKIPEYGELNLYEPIQRGYVEIVEHAFKSKWKIIERYHFFYRHDVIRMLEMVELLLRSFENIDSLTIAYSIHTAVQLGYLEVLKTLVSSKYFNKDLLERKTSECKYSPPFAFMSPYTETADDTCRLLLLDVAAQKGYLEIVRFLLNIGDFINICSYNAIEIAANKGYFEIVKELMKHKIPYYSNRISNNFPEITAFIEKNGYNSSKDTVLLLPSSYRLRTPKKREPWEE